jgi:hypothetical protein
VYEALGHICCLQGKNLTGKDTHILKIKGWKTIYQRSGKWKQAGVAIFTSSDVNTKTKNFKKGYNDTIY